jgi:hypothetical protein
MITLNKTYKISTFLLFATVLISTGCDSSTSPVEEESQLQVFTAADIPANPDGERNGAPDYTFFSLINNDVVADTDSNSTNWDLAFNATTILVNNGTSGPGKGGAVILDQAFGATTLAPSEGYAVDTDSSKAISDWYSYNMEVHAIVPKSGKTIIVRTGDGSHYAKIEILSYYKGNPDVTSPEFMDTEQRPPSRYYTFKYAIQMNGSTQLN